MRQVAEIAEGAAQTADDVVRVAALLFVNYIDAANTVAESYGGGGGVESNWGRRKDEDDEWYARRCIEKANWLCKPMRRNIGPKR